MSTPTDKPAEGASAPAGASEDLKNIKAEFNRKLDNVTSTLKQTQDALLAQLQAMTKPQPPQPSVTPDDDLEGTFYKDPKAYAAKVAEMTERRIEEKFSKREAETQKRQITVAALYKEFPELNADDHEFTQLAVKKFNDMKNEYGESPATYKAAVNEAALELGIKPKSKRPPEDDNYSVGGSGRGRAAKKSDELDPRVVETAKLMGVDPERIKKRQSGRKNFGSWE